MNIVLVYSKKSGSARSLVELRELFEKYNITIEQAISFDDTFRAKLRPAIRAGKTIAVVGGDGTISAVASRVAGTKAVLAPLPGGTLNHFTKDLSIPQDLDHAIKQLPRSKIRAVDFATVNDVVFINNSSLGLYPSSLQERSRIENILGKWLAAFLAGFRVLIRLKTYHVTIAGESFYTPFVFVGNNIYKLDTLGGAARSHINEGKLSVFIVRATSRFVLGKIAFMTLLGKSTQLDEFDVREVTNLTISAKSKHMHISHDGERQRCNTPLKYQSHAKGLRIRV